MAVVSDEADPSFAQAADVCIPLGIRAYELRRLGCGRVPDVADAAVAEVARVRQEHDLHLLGLSPGFGKIAVDDSRVAEELDTGLSRAFCLAEKLDVPRITFFAYRRSDMAVDPVPAQVVDCLGIAADRCRCAGLQMLIENVTGSWADTGARLAAVARAIDVGVTWDPGNSEASGQRAFPDGYDCVRGLVRHVHLKNWLPETGNVAILDGAADLAGQVAALKADQYDGYYCLEPHKFDDGPRAVRTNARQLLELLARSG